MKEVKKNVKYREVLSHTFLFKGLDTAAVLWAYRSSGCFCAQFEPEEKVYTRAEYLKCMGVVLSGRLKVLKESADGSSMTLNTFCRGGVFGVAGLFGNAGRYVSDIVAVCPCRILFLSQPLLRGLFHKEPRAAENYIEFLSGRICFLNTCIDHFAGGSAESRLADFLLSQTLPVGEKSVCLSCSLTRLAEILGIGRASLYRAFDELTVKGAIRRSGKSVEILDAEKLGNIRY